MGGTLINVFRPECPMCKSRDGSRIALEKKKNKELIYYCNKDNIVVIPTETEKKLVLPKL